MLLSSRWWFRRSVTSFRVYWSLCTVCAYRLLLRLQFGGANSKHTWCHQNGQIHITEKTSGGTENTCMGIDHEWGLKRRWRCSQAALRRCLSWHNLSFQDVSHYWLIAFDSLGLLETTLGRASCCAHVMTPRGPCWDSSAYMEIRIHMSCLMVYADGGWGQNQKSNVQLRPHVLSHSTSKEYEMRLHEARQISSFRNW